MKAAWFFGPIFGAWAASIVCACGETEQKVQIGDPAADRFTLFEVTYDAEPRLAGGRLEEQAAHPWSLTQTDAESGGLARCGHAAQRSELRFGDDLVFGGPRAEIAAVGEGRHRYRPGDHFYYGFSVHLAPDWTHDGGAEDIVFQWKNIAVSEPGEAGKSPDIFLAIKRDEFVLRVTSDPNRVSSPDSSLKQQFLLLEDIDLSAGGWHDFVFAIQWSYLDDGKITVWHKEPEDSEYLEILDVAGPNMHNDTQPGYLKWGIYKPAWKTARTATDRRVVHHDNIRVAERFDAGRPDVCGI